MTQPEIHAPATRDKERTRQLILETAERLFVEQGTGVSLATIATEAGLAKGGLMHHFPSRDALIQGVIEHGCEKVWQEVHACVDPADDRPGSLTRGYVRAFTGDSRYLEGLFSASGIMAVFGHYPAVQHTIAQDARLWREAFEEDGLTPARVLAVRYAAEGLALSMGSPYLDEASLAIARAELLALTL